MQELSTDKLGGQLQEGRWVGRKIKSLSDRLCSLGSHDNDAPSGTLLLTPLAQDMCFTLIMMAIWSVSCIFQPDSVEGRVAEWSHGSRVDGVAVCRRWPCRIPARKAAQRSLDCQGCPHQNMPGAPMPLASLSINGWPMLLS